MKDKLCVTDRRLQMLEYRAINKFATRHQLRYLKTMCRYTQDKMLMCIMHLVPDKIGIKNRVLT